MAIDTDTSGPITEFGIPLSDEDMERLPIGAILLDPEGVIQRCNQAGARVMGLEVRDVIGRIFFSLVPSTKTPDFQGRFDSGVALGRLNETIDTTFLSRHVSVRVRVHMRKALASDTYWLFVKPLFVVDDPPEPAYVGPPATTRGTVLENALNDVTIVS